MAGLSTASAYKYELVLPHFHLTAMKFFPSTLLSIFAFSAVAGHGLGQDVLPYNQCGGKG
jgi:hypothetical protein